MKNKPFKIVTALILCANLFTACHSDKKDKEEQQALKQENAIDTPTVVLATVQKGKINSSIAIPGELIPYEQVDLYAKVNSYVKKLYADIGSQVKQGQLLATLEAPEINSQLAQSRSRIKQQEAVYYASKAT
ncbi:MAG: biotin/lipoyl-binding protein, partial [Bacteroidota bacterium]|nr:biotin/lipoyl-binding protein [Bacteroidota bacterium]